MLRTRAWEGGGRGEIRWKHMVKEITEAIAKSDFLVRAVQWAPWLATHSPTVLNKITDKRNEQGVGILTARAQLGGVGVGPLTLQGSKKFRRQTQRWFVNQLVAKDGFCPEQRIRAVMTRWRLEGLPARIARTVTRQLQQLRRLVAPRLRAATMSTIFNRWVTSRRMRQLQEGRQSCVLHCSDTADDSIEHYFNCPIYREWCRRRLGFDQQEGRLVHGLLATSMTGDAIKLQAVATYVLYRTTNHMRRQPFRQAEHRARYVQQYMDQSWHEAARDDGPLRSCCAKASLAASRKRAREQDTDGTPDERPATVRRLSLT